MASPKVLLVSQATIYGMTVHLRDLLRAAAESPFSVSLACPENDCLRKEAIESGASFVPFPLHRSPSTSDFRHIRDLREMAQSFDLLHLHCSKAGALGRIALMSMPRKRRPKCLFTPNGWSWLVDSRITPLYRVIEYALAPLADAIIAVSESEKAAGLKVLGAGRAELRVIENGVDTDLFTPEGARAVRSREPLVVVVGRLVFQKGQDVAIRALSRLTHSETALRLVGDGPTRHELQLLAERLGVAERVEFTGRLEDVRPQIRAADVVVVPSRWDGLSFSLLEAMACGAAIVATKVSGSEALGSAGVIVPIEDPASMAAEIDRLLDADEHRRMLGSAARIRVARSFTVSRSVKRTLHLWDQLLQDGAS